jgi:hypothetical protein
MKIGPPEAGRPMIEVIRLYEVITRKRCNEFYLMPLPAGIDKTYRTLYPLPVPPQLVATADVSVVTK